MSGPLSLPHGTRHGRSQGQPCLQGSETRHMDAGISSYASDSSPALVPAFAPAFVPALAPTGAARWERAAGAGTRARVRLARRKGATAATAVVGAVDTDATASGATAAGAAAAGAAAAGAVAAGAAVTGTAVIGAAVTGASVATVAAATAAAGAATRRVSAISTLSTLGAATCCSNASCC